MHPEEEDDSASIRGPNLNKEDYLRQCALNTAVDTRRVDAKTSDIVAAAETFLAFLKGEKAHTSN